MMSATASASGGGRIGAVIHENFADQPAEWVEWDLDGKLINRTVLARDFAPLGRAFTRSSDGRLYSYDWLEKADGKKARPANSKRVLRVLDTGSGTWQVVDDNLPREINEDYGFLLGSDGDDLVYRVGYGNVRLVWARPGSTPR